MTDYSKDDESTVSDLNQEGSDLYEAVEETISEWVADEHIDVERQGNDIVADEDELVKNILIMIAIALDEVGQ